MAPTLSTAPALASQVKAGTITSSPGPMPRPTRPQISAPVPEVTINVWRLPNSSAIRFSQASAWPPSPPR